MDSRTPYFYKVFVPSICADNMGIPPAFWKYVEAGTRRIVSLEDPSGKMWFVELVDRGCGMFFEKGWKEFVADQSVSAGDFLLFRYDGGSKFTVIVFGPDACEKVGAFSDMPCQDTSALVSEPVPINMRETQDEESPIALKRKRERPRKEAVGNEEGQATPITIRGRASEKNVCESVFKKPQSSTVGVKNKTQVHTEHSSLKTIAPSPHVERACSNLYDGAFATHCGPAVMRRERNIARPVTSLDDDEEWTPIISKTRNSGKQSARKLSKNVRSNCVDIVKFDKNADMSDIKHVGPLKSQRRPVTVDEVQRAFNMSRCFTSKNPFTTVVMRESYCYCYFHLNLPFTFAKKHLPQENGRMTLWDPQGKAWNVTYLYYNRRAGLKSGWSKFSLGNNLEKDDVCIFEVIGFFQMRVHIFRVVKELTPLIPEPLVASVEAFSRPS